MAYGLNSPIYSFGEVHPQIVTISHDHADHAGGSLPANGAIILRGESPFDKDGLDVTPIPTYETDLSAPDNSSFLLEYGGL
ncbi:MAG: MBL fold metallo-hydrolase, partial [Marinobacter sp.]|nr:MBL fold metallo-hydrolase [Marinobacter sp.]